MCNVPLHHYFSSLGASKSCLERPELILVDDNARVSAPPRLSTNKSGLRKISRWDSTGCLPRLGNEELTSSPPCDTSPSLLKHCKSMQYHDASLVPPTPTLRRCQSEQVFHSPFNANQGIPLKPDQPLRRPVRHTLTDLPQIQDASTTASEESPYHYSKSNMETANLMTSLPSKLCQLPYDVPQTLPIDLQDLTSADSFDFDQLVDLDDWD